MTRKPRPPKVPPLVTLPPEGSPGDWYARGYEAGFVEGHANAIREVQQLALRVRRTAETAALAAQAAEATDRDAGVLARGLQDRYGAAARNPDRWQESPAYHLGARAYADSYGRSAKPEAVDRGPTLTLGDPAPPADPGPEADPEFDPKSEARRAEGRAWRA